MMDIKTLCREAHETAVKKGWWVQKRSKLELLALIVSEVGEAVEEVRKNNGYPPIYLSQDGSAKPEGLGIELADVVIRIADMCGKHGIDLDHAVKVKMEYNKSRPHRHGGKLA